MNTRGSTRKRALTTNTDEQETPLENHKKQKVMVSKHQDSTVTEETNARIRLLIQELDRLGHADTARHLETQSVCL
jgi:hypothetical protein